MNKQKQKPMNEFIFSIRQIFSGCESIGDNPRYYIGPYQRGYKWGAESRYDQVPQLLFDTYEAFFHGIESYYLQYITVKEDRDNNRFEVIDGQQRLTTLSILFYLLPEFQKENIAKDKVNYSRYSDSNNSDGNVFEQVIGMVANEDESKDQDIPEQDVYYLVRAARCIKRFLVLLKANDTLEKYIDFLNEHVMIIMNRESEFCSAEETFTNLNDNKVPLTNTYLIKGLLLTLAVRRESTNNMRYSYEEILNQRSILGREWDEIYSWINNPMVSEYFYKTETKDKGMEYLLKDALSFIGDNVENEDSDELLKQFADSFKCDDGAPKGLSANFELFNEYNEKVKDSVAAFEVLNRIKHIYRKLKGIYDQDGYLFNLLGYVMFCEKTTSELKKFKLSEIYDKSTQEIKSMLKKYALLAIPDLSVDISLHGGTDSHADLRYDSNNKAALTNLLLSFSVFPEQKDDSYRFDFCSYVKEKWSFEHISPQHPKTDVTILGMAKLYVKQKITKNYADDAEKSESLIQKIDAGEKIPASDIGFLYGSEIDLHSLGNMALLSGGANSALSNNPYVTKRDILFDKLNSGYFIPRHTMDVFNKVLNTPSDKAFSPDLHTWTNDDVEAHIGWMEARNKNIRKELSE